MSVLLKSPLAEWLQAKELPEKGHYHLEFAEHHLGNIYIRSFHGGVTGAMIELSAEVETRRHLCKKTHAESHVSVVSTSIDYLRITRDTDLFTHAEIQRLSRRLSVVNVTCWQEAKDMPVARGIVTLKVS